MSAQKSTENPLTDIMTINEFIELHPTLMNIDRFNFYLRNRDKNGLAESGALVKIGKRYNIKYTTFSQWLYRHINIYGRDR